MSIEDIKRELYIRKVLRQLSRQRVVLVLQPENVWIIEKAIERNDKTDAALNTCHMRGWIEILHDSVPMGKLKPDGSLPDGKMYDSIKPSWKLTDSGWAAINRVHEWTLLGILIALMGLFLTIAAL